MCESPQTHVMPGSCEKLILYPECQKYGIVPHRETLFGSDDMNNACSSVSNRVGKKRELHTLTPVRQTEVSESKFFGIFFDSQTLRARIGFCYERIDRLVVLAGDGTCIE